MIKKFLALFAIAAILAMAFSCSGEKKDDPQQNGGDSDSPNQQTTNTEDGAASEDLPDLPEITFGGAEFRLLLSGWSGVDFECEEEIAGDRLNDVIYQRNLNIEEKYGIVIKTVNLDPFDSFGPSSDSYRKAARSGSDEYDAFFGIQQYSLVDSMNNLNVEYNESLPYVDLDKPWWDSGILDVCYGNKVYFAAGDITHSTLGYTTLLMFNKYLFNESGIDYPYQSVKDGTWTYDKFVGIIKDLARDLDGDGKMDYRHDLFTIAGWQYEIPYNFHTVLGGNEVIKNKDGYPEIDIFSEKSMAAIDKVLDLFSDYGGFYNNKNYGEDRNMFKDRRLYFLDVRMFEIERYDFRSMEDDFGMIPHPKLDLETPYYTQLVNNNVVTVTTVPVTNTRLEMTSILLEALGYEGKKTISPEYKEVLLQTKLTRDNDSADMFEYIWGHRTYRYGLEAFNNTLNANVIGKGDRAYVSTYEKLTAKAETEIETIKEFFFN
jgi:ABC-type glycerol-3-phosphate transport system substrate-binding protein